MVNVSKIKDLAKSKGVSIAFICSSVGMQKGYLNDIARSDSPKMPEDRLAVIADILNTTVEYLTDQTDDPSRRLTPEESAFLSETPSLDASELIRQGNTLLRHLSANPDKLLIDQIKKSPDTNGGLKADIIQLVMQLDDEKKLAAVKMMLEVL